MLRCKIKVDLWFLKIKTMSLFLCKVDILYSNNKKYIKKQKEKRARGSSFFKGSN